MLTFVVGVRCQFLNLTSWLLKLISEARVEVSGLYCEAEAWY